MPENSQTAVTLGDKLKPKILPNPFKLPLIFILSPLVGLLTYLIAQNLIIALTVTLFCAVYFALVFHFRARKKQHFLFVHDRQRFMKSLKLAEKTAIFDGNNIYHFGLKHGLGVTALKTLIQNLRTDGYRIICFFDANIYFTLKENNEFDGREKHTIHLLSRLFDLKPTETYVVPSRNQADRFIIESLSHLPISFAVTNDRFRDFEAEYDFLTKDNQWRKGVTFKNGALTLFQYALKTNVTGKTGKNPKPKTKQTPKPNANTARALRLQRQAASGRKNS